MPTEPIEASYTTEEPAAPQVSAPGLDRVDVLGQARKLAAECNGVAALVELHAHELRPELVDAWRRWYGAWLGRHIELERHPFKPAETDAEVMRWQQRLAAWRVGLRAEPCFNTAPQPAAASAGVPGMAPQVIAPPAGEAKRGWPRWAVWLGIGGGVVLLWKVGQWIFGPSYSSTSQVVTDVTQTADAVNEVRKERRAA